MSSSRLCSFLYNLPCCLLSAGIYLGRRLCKRWRKKRGSVWAQLMGNRKRHSVLLGVWTVNSLVGRAWRKCLEKKKRRAGLWKEPLNRDALRIPKLQGWKFTLHLSTQSDLLSSWPSSWELQANEPDAPPWWTWIPTPHTASYTWPQEALLSCSHPPYMHMMSRQEGCGRESQGGVTRSKLLREH